LLVGLLLAALVLAGACSGAQHATSGTRAASNAVGTAPPVGGTVPSIPAAGTIAVPKKEGAVAVYGEPGAVQPDQWLANPWLYQNKPEAPIPRVFLVKEDQGEWINVFTGEPPSFSQGWVKRDDVTLQPIYHRIEVRLSQFNLKAYHGDEVILDTTVAIGQQDRPTAGGLYFINVFLKTPDPGGTYGPYAFGLSGYSNDPEVKKQFGGNGQLGIHGTNEPHLLGTMVSNGCIRLSNDDITTLARIPLPLGTPVQIIA
jgi:lipoprotein-anchoring transpeptidase ErfK/SrfK